MTYFATHQPVVIFLLVLALSQAADDAAIFQAVVQDLGGRDLLVANRTIPLCGAPPCLRDRDVLAALRRAAGERYAAFEARNREPVAVPPLRGARMESPEVIARAMDAGGWQELYCLYPTARAAVYVSAPAYLGDEAIVYVEEACDWQCGSGWYFRFTRDGKGWKIVERIDLWMSTP